MYIYPPIIRFEVKKKDNNWYIVNPEEFKQYDSKPYIYNLYEFKNITYLCVWKYDEENKVLIGHGGQSQPYNMQVKSSNKSGGSDE